MTEAHSPQAIRIRNAHLHNLKNIDVDIPLNSIDGGAAAVSLLPEHRKRSSNVLRA